MTGELTGGPEHTKISNQFTIMRKHQFILPMLLLLSSCGKVPNGTFTVAAVIQQMTAKTSMDDISSSGNGRRETKSASADWCLNLLMEHIQERSPRYSVSVRARAAWDLIWCCIQVRLKTVR